MGSTLVCVKRREGVQTTRHSALSAGSVRVADPLLGLLQCVLVLGSGLGLISCVCITRGENRRQATGLTSGVPSRPRMRVQEEMKWRA